MNDTTNFQGRWIELLGNSIAAWNSTKMNQNINQVADAYRRANTLLDKAASLFDREYLHDGDWHGLFVLMLAAHGHDKELTFNEIEDLSDRAVQLHRYTKQL